MRGFGNLESVFDEAGAAWNVDPNLLRAVATQESGGNARALSKAGAQGLMQIIPETQKQLGMTNGMDPVQSIWGGAKYLSQGLDAEGTPEGALLYYHGGPGWRDSYGPESRGYVPGVTAKFQQIVARQGAGGGRGTAAPQPAPARATAPPQSAPPPDAAPDFDEFLKRTGAGEAQPATPPASSPNRAAIAAGAAPKAPEAEDPDAFLKRTGATVASSPPPPAAAPPPVAEAGPPMADPYGTPWIGEGSPTVAQGQAAGQNALNGITEDRVRAAIAPAPNTTYGEVLPFAKDDATGAVRFALPSGVRNMLSGLVDLPGGFRTGTVTPEGTNALAGIVMGGMASPAANTGKAVAEAAAQRAAAPRGIWTEEMPRFTPAPGSASEKFASATVAEGAPPANMLPIAPDAAAAAQRAPVLSEPLPPAPSAGMGGPSPNAAGAQASTATEAAMTPAQVQAYRSTAEGQKLLEVQQPGQQDLNAYVPGVNPNRAEREQSVNTARELKAANLADPAVSAENKTIAAAHNEARGNFFANIAGSDVDVANAKAARAAQAESDLAATWARKTDANAQPLLDLADQIRASPDGRRPVVRKALDNITNELTDADGNLFTDPEQLYGVRKHIDDLMSKEAGADDPKSVRAMAAMGQMKEALDAVIAPAAPGFRQYLDNFSTASRPIDAMEVLQKHENRLFDSQGRMGYNKVQTMMRQIVDSRAAPGINPYKSLTDEQMQRLWALRDDLRRSASAQELARTPGSDTAQNLRDAIVGVGKLGGEAALHGGAALIAPGAGNAAVWIGKNALSPIMAARRARRQTARGMDILNPDPSELRNPFQD